MCAFLEPTKKRGPQKDYKQRVSTTIDLIEKTLIKLQRKVDRLKEKRRLTEGLGANLNSLQGKNIIINIIRIQIRTHVLLSIRSH